MDYQNNEIEIRTQLEAYYSGRLEGDCEAAGLLERLRSLQPLPSDLEADMRMLSAIVDASHRIDVPETLTRKLEADMAVRALRERRRLRRRIASRYAAAVLLVGTVAFTYMRMRDIDVDLSAGGNLALVDTLHSQASQNVAPTVDVQPTLAGERAVAPIVTKVSLDAIPVAKEEEPAPRKSVVKLRPAELSAAEISTLGYALNTLRESTDLSALEHEQEAPDSESVGMTLRGALNETSATLTSATYTDLAVHSSYEAVILP